MISLTVYRNIVLNTEARPCLDARESGSNAEWGLIVADSRSVHHPKIEMGGCVAPGRTAQTNGLANDGLSCRVFLQSSGTYSAG